MAITKRKQSIIKCLLPCTFWIKNCVFGVHGLEYWELDSKAKEVNQVHVSCGLSLGLRRIRVGVYGWHIPRILFFLGTILQNYSGYVKTLSSLSVLRHRLYRIAHQRWHTSFCGFRQTMGLFWWKFLGASKHDWWPCWRLASRFDNMSMWTTVKCPPVWLVIVSTS